MAAEFPRDSTPFKVSAVALNFSGAGGGRPTALRWASYLNLPNSTPGLFASAIR